MSVAVGNLFFEPMLGHEKIQERISELGQQFNQDYTDKTPLFIGVLSGCFMFLGDLMKTVSIPSEIAFIKIASYKGQNSTGQINLELGLNIDLNGRHIIIVEDIVDTGHTLAYLLKLIEKEKPASIQVCSLLYKPEACQQKFKELNYIGFEIPNDFVVGYGLDYDGLGRNLKDIYRLAAN